MVPILVEGSIRLDCRQPTQSRDVQVLKGNEAVTVTIGGTRVIAYCKAVVARPLANNPTSGFLTFTCEITPMADTKENKQLECHISKCLNKAIKRSHAVDTESLVIIPGEWVWNISCHIKVIDNEGNATDACLLAAIAALLGFKRPDVTVEDDKVIVHPITEKYPIPLTFHHIPVATTFVVAPTSAQETGKTKSELEVTPLLDPSYIEESQSTTLITICTNIHRQLISLATFGECQFEQDVLSKCIAVALNRSHPLTESIRSAVLNVPQHQK